MTLLKVTGLHLELEVARTWRVLLWDVSFHVRSGEAVGLVGESGSGKSLTVRSIINLLPRGSRVTGSIEFDGRSVLAMDEEELRRYRASDLAVVFQDPRAYINPVRTVGDYLTEGMRLTQGMSAAAAQERARDLLTDVRIDDADRRLDQWPHEMSGGMLQRIMIAAALATNPRLLLADEPTTALDVTTQEEVMAILDELRRDRQLAMLFVTHDLELAAATCDRTAVLYAGRIVEEQPAAELDQRPLHPYSIGLLETRPDLSRRLERLPMLSGRPLSAYEAPPGCAFAPRCAHAIEICRESVPELREFGRGHVACHRVEEIASERQEGSQRLVAADRQ